MIVVSMQRSGLWQCDGHFTVPAVKMQGETASVVEKEERAAVLSSLMYRAHPEFVSYAVSGTHELCVFCMSQFICRLNGFRTCSTVDIL